MKIANIDTEKKVLIVAEIGNNHEGRFEVAQELVRQAADCGVDAVKFQTFQTEHYIDRADSARFARLKSFELTPSQFRTLGELTHSLGLLYLSTPFDLTSVDVLEPLVDGLKISSGDLSFYPLIARVLQTNKPVILSTGASDIPIIERTLKFIEKKLMASDWLDRIALLHCVSSYPAPANQINLRVIPMMAEKFSYVIGYSDHTIGNDAAAAAAALGARIIEKHFTLDKNYSPFRDHRLSADPADMTELVRRVRATELLLGKTQKNIQPCEADIVLSLRRSIVAAHDLSQNTILKDEDLSWTRPAGGLSPGQEELLIGKRLLKATSSGHRFQTSDVE